MNTPLVVDIHVFMSEWVPALSRLKLPKKISAELTHLLNTEFHIPVDVPIDTNDQTAFIIYDILLPIVAYLILVKKFIIVHLARLMVKLYLILIIFKLT